MKNLISEWARTNLNQLAWQPLEFVRDNYFQWSKYRGEYTKCDWMGKLLPDAAGGDAPVIATYRGGVRKYLYSNTKKGDGVIHVPHDYALGTDLYMHMHSSHNGTSASGDFVYTLDICHDVDNRRTATVGAVQTWTGLTIPFTGVPQYRVPITDVLIATAGGGTSGGRTLFDANLILPDDEIVFTVTVTGTPTITGGSAGVFITDFDIHASTTNAFSGTKNFTPGSFSFWD